MWVCTIFLVLMTKMTLVSLFLKLNNKLVSGLLILNSLKCMFLVEYYITASSVGERLWDHFNYSRNKPTVDYLCISFANGNGNFPSTRMNINKSFVVIFISAKISFFSDILSFTGTYILYSSDSFSCGKMMEHSIICSVKFISLLVLMQGCSRIVIFWVQSRSVCDLAAVTSKGIGSRIHRFRTGNSKKDLFRLLTLEADWDCYVSTIMFTLSFDFLIFH